MKILPFGIIAAIFLWGCAGEVKELQMKDSAGETKTIEFPKGTITGAASKEQASTLAQIFVESHNMAIGELTDIKAGSKKSLEAAQRIEGAIQKLEDSNKKIWNV